MRARNIMIFTAIIFTAAIATLGACSSGSSKPSQSTAPISPVTTTSRPASSAPGSTTRRTTSTDTVPAPRAATAADLAAVRVRLRPVVSGLSSPVAIAFRPKTGVMYVAEQGGLLRVVRNGHAAPAPALDLRGNLSHGNEQGFLGVTFSPDGAQLYVSYTDRSGNTNVDAYAMRGANAEPATRRRVFFTKQPYSNHNGGEVITGPDGMLYIGLGDGGSEDDPQNYGQNLQSPLSKILRVNPKPVNGASYSIPADNPFVLRKNVVRETWMWGLRNPWRFTFDRVTGAVWIGDVGQDKYEEIDYAPRGKAGINWGWSVREGLHAYKGARPPGAVDPIVEAAHADGYCAIVGGYVYRGSAISALDGIYVYGDDCRAGIEALVQHDGRAIGPRGLGVSVDSLTTFGEDAAGEIYAAARGGTIYKFAAA